VEKRFSVVSPSLSEGDRKGMQSILSDCKEKVSAMTGRRHHGKSVEAMAELRRREGGSEFEFHGSSSSSSSESESDSDSDSESRVEYSARHLDTRARTRGSSSFRRRAARAVASYVDDEAEEADDDEEEVDSEDDTEESDEDVPLNNLFAFKPKLYSDQDAKSCGRWVDLNLMTSQMKALLTCLDPDGRFHYNASQDDFLQTVVTGFPGSGKTHAMLCAMNERVKRRRSKRGVYISPTEEMAEQSYRLCESLQINARIYYSEEHQFPCASEYSILITTADYVKHQFINTHGQSFQDHLFSDGAFDMMVMDDLDVSLLCSPFYPTAPSYYIVFIPTGLERS